MLDEGWLLDGWEDRSEIRGKRPPRRYYELTNAGRDALGAMTRAAREESRVVQWSERWHSMIESLVP